MARLQQLHPGDYKTSANISSEIENVIRYLNSAELGNQTLRELLSTIFNADGEFDGPIEFRFDGTRGLEYRIGDFASDADGWQTLASADALRGAPGTDIGEIEAAPLTAAFNVIATANQVNFPFVTESTDALLVFRNGLLQREGASFDYQRSGSAVIFNAPQPVNTVITMIRARGAAANTFRQTIAFTVAPQSVFSYPVDLLTQDIFVYRNGLLQREGGTADYVRNSGQNTITFLSAIPANDTITIYGWASTTNITIPGLMLERNFVDPTTGLIPLAKVAIADNALANSKVNGLATLFSQAARLHIGGTAPSDPLAQRLWLDTSTAPASLRVYDGAIWLRTTIENLIPPYAQAQARQFLTVNALGDALVWASVDLSSVVPRTFRGAANGVASLDADGRLPASQLPSIMPADTVFYAQNGTISAGVYPVKRLYGQRLMLTGFSGRLTGGSCTAQLQVGGVNVGPSFTLSATPTEAPLGTPIEVDASTASRLIAINVTAPSSATNIEISLAARTIF
jgi:hypothetical protein